MNKKRFLTTISSMLAASLILTACGTPIHITKTPAAAEVSADEAEEDEGIIRDEAEEDEGIIRDEAEEDDGIIWDEYEESSDDAEEAPLKGILYINRDVRFEENSYSPVDKIIYIGSADIYSLDPETGISTLVRSFPIGTLDDSIGGAAPWVLAAWGFDENYERMSMDRAFRDGSHHVGWVDQDGNYTDVTALITEDPGDFGGVPNQFSGRFGPDNYFYYYEMGEIAYRVPMDNLNPESVEAVDHFMMQYPDGSVACSKGPGFGLGSGTSYTDASMSEERVKHSMDIAWLGNGDYVKVGSVPGTSNYVTLLRENSDGSEKCLLPEVPDRISYNPVASPDGSQIAFMSSLRTRGKDVDNWGYIFSVPSEGGSPVKLADSLRFICRSQGYNYLLEWR